VREGGLALELFPEKEDIVAAEAVAGFLASISNSLRGE